MEVFGCKLVHHSSIEEMQLLKTTDAIDNQSHTHTHTHTNHRVNLLNDQPLLLKAIAVRVHISTTNEWETSNPMRRHSTL